jgi:hypothetical protein
MHDASMHRVLQTQRSGHQGCNDVRSERCTHGSRPRCWPSWLCGGEFRERVLLDGHRAHPPLQPGADGKCPCQSAKRLRGALRAARRLLPEYEVLHLIIVPCAENSPPGDHPAAVDSATEESKPPLCGQLFATQRNCPESVNWDRGSCKRQQDSVHMYL